LMAERERLASQSAASSRPMNGGGPTQAQAAQRQSKKQAQLEAERLARLETEISELEATLEQLAMALQAASNDQDVDKIQNLSIEYAATESRLETMVTEWENFARE
jgi:phage shock protein A